VVIFATDSIESPTFGGEHRSHQLSLIFERHGIRFRHCYSDRFMDHFRPGRRGLRSRTAFLRAMRRGIPLSMLRAMGHRVSAAEELQARLPDYRRWTAEADLVVFDHPFAFPFIEPVLGDRRVVYSSQNIEARILGDYFQRIHPTGREKARLDQRIRAAEQALTRRADLVIACTERDARHYRSDGARRVVVAPNGSLRLPPIEDPELAGVPYERYALFISSGWSPNVEGLLRYCEDLMLPPDRALVCAGGIGDSAHAAMKRLRANASLAFTGRVSHARLGAITSGASAIVIPMLDAGGSNIKTAEALLTRKRILATPHAFRGFEAFAGSAGVTLCPSPIELQKALSETLEQEPRHFERPEAEALLWPAALAPAEEALLELLGAR